MNKQDTTENSSTTALPDTLPAVSHLRHLNLEMMCMALAAFSAVVLIWTVTQPDINISILIGSLIALVVFLGFSIQMITNPDSVRARQTDAMLQLSSATLDCMQEGLTAQAAQSICELLLPKTAATAVAITDTEHILGYAGYQASSHTAGTKIRTQVTRDAIADGQPRILYTSAEIGFPTDSRGRAVIKAAIIMPLAVGTELRGTLKLYFRKARHISETQVSIAHGLATLLSTQMAAVEVETQQQLATSMELKMLQSQINPHFLFNTINTIASFIRTDPLKARSLLRDFAVFYRSTLENSTDRIMLSRELEQTMRYFSFEVARFGEDRVRLYVGVDDALKDMLVPPFLVQPLVENAVKHAMPSQGMLTIHIEAELHGDDVVVIVRDDGVGMNETARNNIMHPESSTGMGIAVKNVHDRMRGFFGARAAMLVESELGKGTAVTLIFPDCARDVTIELEDEELEG